MMRKGSGDVRDSECGRWACGRCWRICLIEAISTLSWRMDGSTYALHKVAGTCAVVVLH